MKITKAEYALSAVNSKQYPVSMEPEIALVGRSNVGKSSLINKFISRKGLARTSSQPGKTQTLNFYHINDTWYFVDLPGYGYAKVSKGARAQWGAFINAYLEKRPQLVGIIHLLDMRHPPSKDDIMMHEWLQHQDIPYILVATKADKLSRGQWPKQKKGIQQGLGIYPAGDLTVFSALTGAGLEEITNWVAERIGPSETLSL